MKILSKTAYRELIAEKELTELSLKSTHFPKKQKSTTFILKNAGREKRRRGRRQKNCEKSLLILSKKILEIAILCLILVIVTFVDIRRICILLS